MYEHWWNDLMIRAIYGFYEFIILIDKVDTGI